MSTYEIPREAIEGLAPTAEGYKVVKYDGGTQTDYHYCGKGEKLVGRVFTCDGEIGLCKNGLHFCENPADVFHFYSCLSYNRYFKVKAYGEIKSEEGENKSAAQTIEFVEEYNIDDYIALIGKQTVSYSKAVSKSYAVSGSYAVNGSTAVNSSCAVSNSDTVNNSDAVSDSDAVNDSYAVSNSDAVSNSRAVSKSDAVNASYAVSYSYAVSNSDTVSDSYAVSNSAAVSDSDAVNDSKAVSASKAVNASNAVYGCFALRNCNGLYCSVFCNKINGGAFLLFNKDSSKERFEEVKRKLLSFNWLPQVNNFYELKSGKPWESVPMPEVRANDNRTAWSKMPQEMLEYIKSLPEYDEEVFNAITGD